MFYQRRCKNCRQQILCREHILYRSTRPVYRKRSFHISMWRINRPTTRWWGWTTSLLFVFQLRLRHLWLMNSTADPVIISPLYRLIETVGYGLEDYVIDLPERSTCAPHSVCVHPWWWFSWCYAEGYRHRAHPWNKIHHHSFCERKETYPNMTNQTNTHI